MVVNAVINHRSHRCGSPATFPIVRLRRFVGLQLEKRVLAPADPVCARVLRSLQRGVPKLIHPSLQKCVQVLQPLPQRRAAWLLHGLRARRDGALCGGLGRGAHDNPAMFLSLDRRKLRAQVCVPGEEEASSIRVSPFLSLFPPIPVRPPNILSPIPGASRELPSVPEQRRGQRAPGAATRGHCVQPRAPLLLPIDLFKAHSAFLIIHHFLPGATYS